MKRLTLVCAIGLCVAAALKVGAQAPPAIELPVDPSTAVIMLDWRAEGLSVPPCPGATNNPLLVIRADGRVTVNAYGGGCRFLVEGMLSAAQVQDLLRFAIVDQEFFGFSAETVRQAIETEARRTARGVAVFDGSTTVIRITTAARNQEASHYALSVYAMAYPTVKALGQLLAVESRLRTVVDEFGGAIRGDVAAALDQANRSLKEQRPELPALGLADYRRTVRSEGERRIVEFAHSLGDAGTVSVTVELPKIRVQISVAKP